jgi:choline dehydrogenase-like flavoprotein
MSSSTLHDAVIVGSGAGGSAAAYQLARAGLHVVLIEKGKVLPKDGSTLDFNRVVHRGEFKSREPWADNRGRTFMPEEYFNLGGKTKWYGAALLRYGVQEFSPEPAYACFGWPIAYDDMVPHYLEAERLLGVRTIEGEPDLRRIADRLVARTPAWSHQSMPMGLAADILQAPAEARHFDGFASVADLKGDAETAFLRRVQNMQNLSILTGRAVRELLGAPNDATRLEGVKLEDGTELRGRVVILAAGALHSPRLLQRYVDARNLAARLPCAANIGRNLKYHLLTAMIGISGTRMTDVIRKTRIFLNTALPHSSVQPLGFDGELMSTLIPRLVPRPVARLVGSHAYGFFLQTEDGAHGDNRVRAASADTNDLPCIDYDAARTPASSNEHRRLVRSFRAALARTGMLAFSQRVGLAGTAHVSGTLSTGSDPKTSVVDAQGRVHGMSSLYVVDGSILPRSSRVNPSLTIYAWALRTAGLLVEPLKIQTAFRGI